ncbi:MAG: FIST N-terminal domain-containing protein [Candidatus Hodarchaeota archaeon]
MKAAVGLNIGHDLTQATMKALDQVKSQLQTKPSLILYFTGSHPGGAKTYNQAMEILKEKYEDVPLVGCSGVGLASKDDYGLKGAGLMFLQGIPAKTSIIKRFRIGTYLKTKKVINDCEKTVYIEKKKGFNTTHIFFPPGLGFPKLMVNLLNHRLEGFNPFFALNNRIWLKFPILSKFAGKLAGISMDIAGIGISYSCAWPLFTKLYEKGIHFTGTFGVDPLTMNKSFQFYNYKAYKDSLAYVSLSSPNLVFESRTDSGATIMPKKRFDLDSYLDGGFIPRIRGKWGADGLLEIYDMEQTPEVLEECTKRYFYYHPYRPLCVIDEENNQNIYGLAINPNLKHALITAPNQIAKKLVANDPKHYQAFICDQSASTIERLLEKTLSELITKDTIFGLFFDCGNRAMIVGDKFDQFAEKFSNYLGNVPYLVIISGGEVNSQHFPIVNFSSIASLAKKVSPIC